MKVLFLCTGNSARSQMAEAFLRHYGGDRFTAYSAGLNPSTINPYTVRVMEELGFDLAEHRAKSVKEYLGGTNFAYVITVCTKAEENCPSTFPGQPVRLAWSFDDPAAFEGDDTAKLQKFREVRDQIRGQITVWLQTQQVAKAARRDRSLFQVPRMDCAAEENLVRMQLDGMATVKSLDFDLSARKVAVYHEGQLGEIESALGQLGLGSRLVETGETNEAAPESAQQRRLLWVVLLINASFFVLEMTTGFISGSMGLVADSLDMLADALVYGLSLLAVGAAVARKKNVARYSGYFQMTLAVLGFVEVLRRFFGVEALPDFRMMIGVSLLALIANGVCLYLLGRSKDKEAHMQASKIFTSNDVIINLGVIVAGVLVLWLGSGIPDLVVGAIVFVIVSLGAVRILRLAR